MKTLLRSKWLMAYAALIVLTAVTFTGFLLALGAEGEQPGPRSLNPQELEQVIAQWSAASAVPGVVVGISLPGQAEMILASGFSDVENEVAIGPADPFRIASISKTFIAVEILRLAAAGKINLDDPLHSYLPETPHGDVVTIRHLLSHRSGYFDPVHDDSGFILNIAENPEKQWQREEVLAITFQHDLFFSPGTSYRYGNVNYMLLAQVIETVTRQTLQETLTTDLISPFQLKNTVYTTAATDYLHPGLPHGYSSHPVTGAVIDTTTIPYTAIASVSVDTMISNASDLLKWSRMLYSRASPVLDPSSQAQMLTFDQTSQYGLGVFRFSTPIGFSVGHGGDTAGYLSLMEYYPDQDMALVILMNTDTPTVNPAELRNALLAALFPATADGQKPLALTLFDMNHFVVSAATPAPHKMVHTK